MARERREHWASRIGIILAVAGSAVGLGNFLRFPGQLASNGGGAFLIPYFIALIFLGIPLMWIEWALGRLGGSMGHGTAPGIFQALWRKNRWIKYLGALGLICPLIVFTYYTFIESWLLGYTWFAITGKYSAAAQSATQMNNFLADYLGSPEFGLFSGIKYAYIFFVITFLLNMAVVYRGISKGIEFLSKIAMPILILSAIIITLRLITLGIGHTPFKIIDGFGYLWNADFSALKSPSVWLAAAGQIFFTLSVGFGVILTYASYLRHHQDVALSGLTSVSINEFCEVILGASIVIPAAFAFFGPNLIKEIVSGGIFNLGFVTMPMVFAKIPLGALLGILWFGLLFLAGITSSVSLAQPAISFLEDEFKLSRHKSVIAIGTVVFILCQAAIFWSAHGIIDELDFWIGTFAIVIFGALETILFVWVFGLNKAWKEIHLGADVKIPKIYKFIIGYITPVALLAILITWFIKDAIPKITMSAYPAASQPYILATRLFLIALFIGIAYLVKIASRKWKFKKGRLV